MRRIIVELFRVNRVSACSFSRGIYCYTQRVSITTGAWRLVTEGTSRKFRVARYFSLCHRLDTREHRSYIRHIARIHTRSKNGSTLTRPPEPKESMDTHTREEPPTIARESARKDSVNWIKLDENAGWTSTEAKGPRLRLNGAWTRRERVTESARGISFERRKRACGVY